MHTPKKETLNFTGFSGYYGLMSAHDGYGGFNYLDDVLYMNTSLFANEPWCDQGYVNVAAKTGASALGWIYDIGVMETANGHSFTLSSFVAASAWSSNQEWRIATYTGSSFTLKGADYVYIGQQAETVKLGKLGKGITAISFELWTLGSAGDTCSYGSGTYGYQLCIGDVKAKFSKKADSHWTGDHNLPIQNHHMHQAHVVAQLAHHTGHVANGSHQAAHHVADAGYHSQLLSLHHDSGGLNAQFSLPHVEHGL